MKIREKMERAKKINQDMIIFWIAVLCCIFIFVYAATYYMPDKLKIEGWFSMITNMAISYVAATFFYYFQVYRPQRIKQSLAIEVNRDKLAELQKMLEVTALIVEKHFIIENDHLDILWNGAEGEEKYIIIM